MKYLILIFVLAVFAAFASSPFMVAEEHGVTKIELTSWKGTSPETVFSINLGDGVMTKIFFVSFSIIAVCSALAIGHDAQKYGFRWEERNKIEKIK